MLTSLVAENASGQRPRQRLAQVRGFGWWERRPWGAVAQAEYHPMVKSNPVDDKRIADPVESQASAPREIEEGAQNSEGTEATNAQERCRWQSRRYQT